MEEFSRFRERDFVGVGAGVASRGVSKSEAARDFLDEEWMRREIALGAQLNPMFPYLRTGFDPGFWFGGG